ncbi:MAG: PqiC family protein [Candidatus Brocadiia bacterium]|jgi:uncharacterized lipoprotein YmbA
MSRRAQNLWLAAGLAATLLMTGACARSQQTRYYVLSPLAEGANQAARVEQAGPRLFVDSVVLPAYLVRPEIVTRLSSEEVKPLEFRRWAEPLEAGLTRVLAENLSALLPVWRVETEPTANHRPGDFMVSVRVTRLDADAKAVNVAAEWSVRDRTKQETVFASRVAIAEAVTGAEPDQIVAALNRAVYSLSKQIADSLKPIGGEHGKAP